MQLGKYMIQPPRSVTYSSVQYFPGIRRDEALSQSNAFMINASIPETKYATPLRIHRIANSMNNGRMKRRAMMVLMRFIVSLANGRSDLEEDNSLETHRRILRPTSR